MGLFFPDYGTSFGEPRGQKYSVATVVAAHVALLGLIAVAVPADRLAEMARPFTARLIELAPKEPPAPPPRQTKKAPPAPLPILTSNTVSTDAQATFVVAPQPPAPPAPPAPVAISAPTGVQVTAARFDADYLDNPKPVYPHASRRLREQGKVLLRVRVTPAGLAERVEIKQTSGFQRLDQAAEEVVGRWRFVPARRGDEAIAAWVLVPISFNLQEG